MDEDVNKYELTEDKEVVECPTEAEEEGNKANEHGKNSACSEEVKQVTHAAVVIYAVLVNLDIARDVRGHWVLSD